MHVLCTLKPANLQQVMFKQSYNSNIENLNEDFFKFVHDNKHKPIADILLREEKRPHSFDLNFAAVQIECRKRCARKLAGFLTFDKFLFPDLISSEQASDELVAAYHSELVAGAESFLDMTAGLGIDSFSMSRKVGKSVAIELDVNKAAVLEYNRKILSAGNMSVINTDSVEYVRNLRKYPEIIFIDPARRDMNARRTYSFSDSIPDITVFYKTLLDNGCRILIKASPMLDITNIRRELYNILSLHIVLVKGECKEVLVELKKGAEETEIIVADIGDNGFISRFSMEWSEFGNALAPIYDDGTEHLAGSYLYEPNAGLMKLTASDIICERFPGLMRASNQSYVFIGKEFYPDFPGRVMKIAEVVDKKRAKQIAGGKYNVVSKGYPVKADELRKKLKVKEGKDNFIYGIRLGKNSVPTLLNAIRQQPL